MLFEGFDDDFHVPERLARPVFGSQATIASIQHAVLQSDAASLHAGMQQVLDAHDAPATSLWRQVMQETLHLAIAVVEARWRDALSSPVAAHLFAAVTPEEAEFLGGTLRPDTFQDILRLLQRRTARWVQHSSADALLDSSGSCDTLQHARTLCVCLLAAVCAHMFVQANYTGPDFTAADLNGLYPLPFLRAFVDSEDAGVAVQLDAWRRDDASVAQWDSRAGGPAAVSAPAVAATTSSRTASSTAITALQLNGDEMYEHVRLPHLLCVARALTAAAVAVHPTSDSLPWMHALRRAPDMRRVHEVSRTLPFAQWLAARCVVLHQRALVERRPNATLFAEAAAYFRQAAALTCPQHVAAFTTQDVFQRHLVEKEVAATGVRGDRHALFASAADDASGSSPGEPADTADAPTDARDDTPAPAELPAADTALGGDPAPAAVAARLLLEWGQAQHFFDHPSAAKTSFFLARRESGLLTQLTGAMGKRTKFQAYDLAQLVLRARSDGQQAEQAIADAHAAAEQGSTDGRFGLTALRASGLAPAVDSTATDVSTAIVPPAAAASGEDAKHATADTPAIDTPATDTPAVTTVLGGVRAVTLTEVNADTHLLEAVQLRDAALQGVVTPADVARDEMLYGKGWAATVLAPSSAAAASTSDTADDIVPAPIEDGPLSALDQCIVLALCMDIRNHNPSDGLTQEEMRPYVARVLDTPLNWMVYSSALLVKTWLELESHHTAERAVLQLQALVDQHTNRLTALQSSQRVIDEAAPARLRLSHVFCTAFPPQWQLKRHCADRYRKLMVLRSALQLYEELEMWEDIIDVCVLLDQVKRAERLVRARLAAAPTPRLWCTLGVVTDTDEPFVTAWETSNHTFGKAQLALGRRFADKGDVPAAIAALRLGLQASPQHEKEWFLLGALCMRTGAFDESLAAFGRVVALDALAADAWANMGSIHLHQHQWEQGYATLEQALRADRKDWRMWSNFLVACVRTRHFSRAIYVMHQLLGLRHDDTERHEGVDVPALTTVVKEVLASLEEDKAIAASAVPSPDAPAIVADAPVVSSSSAPVSLDVADESVDAAAASEQSAPRVHVDHSGAPASSQLPALVKLFGHITAAVTKNAHVWLLYACLHDARGREEDALQCRQKACRALQTQGWEKELSIVEALADASTELVEDHLRMGKAVNVAQARMHLQSVIGRVDAAAVHADCSAITSLRALLARVEAAEAAVAST